MAAGSAVGAVIGAAAGSVIPGVGTSMGMAAGSAIGGGIDAAIAGKKAKKARAAIDTVDPDVQNFLTEMKARMKSYKTGSAAGYYKSQIASNTAAAKEGIIQSQGGNTGAVISGLQNANRTAGGAVNQTLAELEQQNQFNTSLVGSLIQSISQRRLELGLVDYTQASAEKAQALSDMNNNIMMAMAMTGDKNSQKSGGGGGGMMGKNMQIWQKLFGNGDVLKGAVDAPVEGGAATMATDAAIVA